MSAVLTSCFFLKLDYTNLFHHPYFPTHIIASYAETESEVLVVCLFTFVIQLLLDDSLKWNRKISNRFASMSKRLQIHHSMCVSSNVHRTSAKYLTLFLPVQLL